MEYDSTTANLTDVMRGQPMATRTGKTHHCNICKKDYPCGPAFCGTELDRPACHEPDDTPCGGCFMRFIYD